MNAQEDIFHDLELKPEWTAAYLRHERAKAAVRNPVNKRLCQQISKIYDAACDDNLIYLRTRWLKSGMVYVCSYRKRAKTSRFRYLHLTPQPGLPEFVKLIIQAAKAARYQTILYKIQEASKGDEPINLCFYAPRGTYKVYFHDGKKYRAYYLGQDLEILTPVKATIRAQKARFEKATQLNPEEVEISDVLKQSLNVVLPGGPGLS